MQRLDVIAFPKVIKHPLSKKKMIHNYFHKKSRDLIKFLNLGGAMAPGGPPGSTHGGQFVREYGGAPSDAPSWNYVGFVA
jgi:hypothetical protein